MTRHTLIIVGVGIKFISHLTTEAKTCIEKADKVLYLLNEPAQEEWVRQANPRSESLDQLYSKHEYRAQNYRSISQYIIKNLQTVQTLCVVMYGHPMVLSQPAVNAVCGAKKNGYEVIVMPGISAEACLYADLHIDPGSNGCQSYEATDFLLYEKEFDPSSHLILWQPYVIGLLGHPINHNPKKGLTILTDRLAHKYSRSHKVVLYEAAQYPTFKPTIKTIILNDLPDADLTQLATLYVS